MSDSPDANCYTLPDGECIGTNCMHDPRRDGDVAAWLRQWREAWPVDSREWMALDDVLDDYRLHADTGTPLSENVQDSDDRT